MTPMPCSPTHATHHQEDLSQLEQLGASLLGVWRRHRQAGSRGAGAAGAGAGRLATPLLAAADLLLSRTALRDLQPPGSAFPEQVGLLGLMWCGLG